MTLADHLTACYRETVMHERTSTMARDCFRDALKIDPDLRGNAESKLSELNTIGIGGVPVTSRCFISRTHAQILADALQF